MKKLLRSSSKNVKKWLIRDAHQPNRVYVHTETAQAPVIEQNQRIRGEQLMKIGQRTPALGDEHADISASFQFPTVVDYQVAREKYPDLFHDLELGGDVAIRAGERLSLLLPQYVTMVKRRDRVATSAG